MKRRRDDRATHCKRGHSLHNAYIDSKGSRVCRTCSFERVYERRWMAPPRLSPIVREWPLSVCAELPLDNRPYAGVNR